MYLTPPLVMTAALPAGTPPRCLLLLRAIAATCALVIRGAGCSGRALTGAPPGNIFGTSGAGGGSPGKSTGLASRQCVPGGIGSTIRSSATAPLLVWLGNQYGVASS